MTEEMQAAGFVCVPLKPNLARKKRSSSFAAAK
jgi:hypothetical protein